MGILKKERFLRRSRLYVNKSKEVVLDGKTISLEPLATYYKYCSDEILAIIQQKTINDSLTYKDREINISDFKKLILTKDAFWELLLKYGILSKSSYQRTKMILFS